MTDTPAPATAPELDAARAMIDRGDFRGARAELAAKRTRENEAAVAALLARIAPDPWAIRLGLIALAALGLVVGLWVR